MKEYEVIWEIFNKCPRNQMRDVFVDEIEIEDPEEYVKNKSKERKYPTKRRFLQTEPLCLTFSPHRLSRGVPLRKSRACQKIIPVILDKLWWEFSRVYFTGNSA